MTDNKKQLSCIVHFLKIDLDTIGMETRLPKSKLKKIIECESRVLESKSFSTREELQSFVGILFSMAKVVYLAEPFSNISMTDYLRAANICIGLSL